MANIPNQNSINEVVTSIVSNMEVTETLIISSIKSINKIADANKKAESGLKSINNLEKVIKSYSAVVSNVIEMLCKDMPNNKSLTDILGRVREIDEMDENHVKEVTRFTVVDAIMQIPTIVNGMFDVLKKASEFKFGYKATRNIRKNIILLKSTIKLLFKEMVDIFSDIVNENDIDKIIKSFVKQPDTINNIVKNNIERTDKNTSIDKSITKTFTKQGQLGLLDVFEKTFSIIGMLNNLQTPNFIVLEARLLKMREALNRVLHHLTAFIDNNITGNVSNQLNEFGVLIGGDQNEKPGLLKTFENIIELIKKSEELNNYTLKLAILNKYGFPVIIETLKSIVKLVVDSGDKRKSSITKLSDEQISKKLERAINNVENIGNLINILCGFAIKTVLFNKFKDSIICSIQSLEQVIDAINNVSIKLTGKFLKSNTIDSIDKVLTSIVKLNKKLAILGPLSIVAAAGALALSICIWALVPLMISLNAFSKFLSKRNVSNISISIVGFGKILGMLLIVSTAIVMLGILTPNILKMSMGVLALIIGFVLLATFIWLSFKFIGKLAVLSIKNMLAFSAVIAILMGTVILAGLVILATVEIYERLENVSAIGKVILFLLGMIALTTVIALLGLALIAIGPVITGSLLGFMQMMALIGVILVTGMLINILAETNLRVEDAKENVSKIFNFIKDLRKQLSDSKDEIGSKRDWKKDKRLLKKVDKTVKEVVDIANKLNYLQTIKIDESAILGNTTQILIFTQKLDDLLSRLVFGRNIDNETNDSNWITRTAGGFFQRGATKRMKKSMKESKKMLSQVDKVILRLSDIGESLITIKDFVLTDKDKTIIEKNIESIFAYIQKVQEKIDKLNGPNIFVTDIIGTTRREIRQARKQKKEYKHSAKSMTQIESIMVSLASITDSLRSIMEFEWNEENNGKLEEKVDLIFKPIKTISKKIENNDISIPNKNVSDQFERLINNINNIIETSKTINSLALEKLTNNVDLISTSLENIVTKINTVNSLDENKLNELTIINDYTVKLVSIIEKLTKTNIDNIKTSSEDIFKYINEITNKNIYKISDENLTNAQNIVNYIETLCSIGNNVLKIKFLDISSIEKYINGLIRIISNVNSLSLSNVSINTDIIKQSIEKLIGINTRLTKQHNSNLNNVVKYIHKLNKEISSIANIDSNGLEKNTNNYIKFVDKVNTMDVKKLETSAKMFEQMSKFSTSIRGDFDRLAEALNENLMPVLEELKEIMEQIPEKLDTGFQNTSASIAATSAPATRENVEAQARRENPNITPEEVKKVVDSRMSEKAKQDATGMISKLDELISLLKGYGGENVVVQTV